MAAILSRERWVTDDKPSTWSALCMLLPRILLSFFFFKYVGLCELNSEHSSLCDRDDIFVTHVIIIIKSEVISTFPITLVVIYLSMVVCLKWLYHHVVWVYWVTYIPGKLGCISFL